MTTENTATAEIITLRLEQDGRCIDGRIALKQRARFPMGMLVITSNAAATLVENAWTEGLGRHLSGDWGDICDEDRGLNEAALKHGSRLLSVYYDRNGTKYWIITEADRSATTILLPEDY